MDLELRKTGIGGSDVAGILGISQWDTPLSIYLDKKGLSKPKEVTSRMEMGNRLEEWIFENYLKSINASMDDCYTYADGACKAEVFNYQPGFKRHAGYEFMLANVDGINEEHKKIIEIKYSKHGHGFGEEGTSDVPLAYRLQVMHYMAVWDYDSADIFVYIDSQDKFKLFHVERDLDMEIMLIDKEKNFWENHVLANVPPDPSTIEEVKFFYNKSEPKSIDANEKIICDVQDLKTLRDKIKELEHKEDEIKKEVMEFMKENDTLILGDSVLATWKEFSTSRFDLDLFKKEKPRLYNKYKKESSSRRMIIKG